jgi:hypothetical protein
MMGGSSSSELRSRCELRGERGRIKREKEVAKEEDDEDEEEDEGEGGGGGITVRGEGGGGAAVPTERAGWDGTVIHGPSALETSAEDAHPDEGEEEGAGELLSVRGRLVTASMPDMLPHHIGRGFLLRDWTFKFDMDRGEDNPARH